MKAIIDECKIGHKKFFKRFLDFLYKTFKISSRKDIAVLFCDVSKITELNYKYRNKNAPTDVLSFYGYNGNILGDIAICPEVAFKEKGDTQEEEYLLFLIAHAFLHLLGYEHNIKEDFEKMVAMQSKLLNEWRLL